MTNICLCELFWSNTYAASVSIGCDPPVPLFFRLPSSFFRLASFETRVIRQHNMGLLKGTTSPGSRDSVDRPIKRQKVTRACDACKSRKRRCTGELPCSLCFNNGAECTYTAAYTRGRLVEPLPSEHATNGNAGARSGQAANAYRDASPDGEMTTFAGQYLGPASPYAFLRRAWKRFGGGGNAERETQKGIDPGQAGSIFSFGDRQVVSQPSTQDFRLPDRATTTKLLNKYFDQTMATYR